MLYVNAGAKKNVRGLVVLRLTDEKKLCLEDLLRCSHCPARARPARSHLHRHAGFLRSDIPYADRIPVVRELITGRVASEAAKGG
jgi:hypothetical protein